MNARAAGRGAVRFVEGGLELRVRLTPKSSGDRVEGMTETSEGPAFAARVRAVPSEGEANEAVRRLVADWLGLAKSCVALTYGSKSRIKVLTVSGDGPALLGLIEARLAALDAGGSKTTKT